MVAGCSMPPGVDGFGRDHVFGVCVPVCVAREKAIGSCRVQRCAKFLRRIVQVDSPLWVTNSIVDRRWIHVVH
jgi:hypothetical protein